MSRSIAISARGLSKRYSLETIASPVEYQTMAELLSGCASFPFRCVTGRLNQKSEGWFWALREIDLDVQHGEVIGIVGRNGNGKSTLLKILSRITSPTSGSAEMHGRVCSLLEVGTGFHPELTGAENIYLNGSILGMTRREIRAKYDEIVAFSEVEQFLNMPVKRYSSGMRVRLAFSVAAHMDPDILIVDEVLAVGDLAFQQKCLQRMNEFASTGRTILFVSHNMPAIESICGRTIQLSKGQIVADGPTREIVPKFIASMVECDAEIGEADISLLDHPKRKRRNRSILTRLRVLDGLGKPSTALTLGSPCSFEICFHEAVVRKGLGFCITISTEQGQKIAILHSRIQSRVVTQGEQEGSLRCTVDELPLLPGTYSIDLSAGTWDQVLDSVEQVTRITILAADYFQTGELPSPNQGILALKGRWSSIASAPTPSVSLPHLPLKDLTSPDPIGINFENNSLYDWR